jgi:hypothetical protein
MNPGAARWALVVGVTVALGIAAWLLFKPPPKPPDPLPPVTAPTPNMPGGKPDAPAPGAAPTPKLVPGGKSSIHP